MKAYVKPTMEMEIFAANEVVAACGDGETTYKFYCNAPAGTLYYYRNGRNNGNATELGDFKPCPAWHEVNKYSNMYDGFIDYNNDGDEDDGEAVIVWRGYWGMNGHATKQLNMDKWEVAKS